MDVYNDTHGVREIDGGLASGQEREEVCGRGSGRDVRRYGRPMSASLAAESGAQNADSRFERVCLSCCKRQRVTRALCLGVEEIKIMGPVMFRMQGRAVLRINLFNVQSKMRMNQ
jgi:hypothetical protein